MSRKLAECRLVPKPCERVIVRSIKNILHEANLMGRLLSTSLTNSEILVISVFLVLGLVACSSTKTVTIGSGSEHQSGDTGSGSNTDGEFVQSSSSDVSLGDVACNIVSVDEIISVVGVGNDEQLVVATGAVNGDNLHCGLSSNGSRNIPNRNNLSLSDAHVTVTMMPIAGPEDLDAHMVRKEVNLENDPNAALPEYGEGAFRTGFGALKRVSGDYIFEVTVVIDRTDEDLAVAKALSELVSSRLEN